MTASGTSDSYDAFWRPVTGVWRRATGATPETAMREAERQRAIQVGELPTEFSAGGVRSWVGLPEDRQRKAGTNE